MSISFMVMNKLGIKYCDEKKLSICDGDYGLPTFNIEYFQLLTYAKMTNHQLFLTDTPWKLPLLILDTGYVTRFENMASYLEKSLDNNLSDMLLCLIFSIKQEMQNTLLPIIEYLYWLNNKNLDEFTSKWYLAAKGFFVYKLHKRHHRRKARLLFNNISSSANLNYVLLILKNNFTYLCKYFMNRLAKTKFIFGDKPTSADAQLYSYLAIILKPPLPSNEFATYIRRNCCPLIKFMERLDLTYFPEIIYEEKYLKRKCSSSKFHKTFAVPLCCVLATFILFATFLWIF